MVYHSEMQVSKIVVLALFALLPFQDGCGTLVGNPKRPPNSQESPLLFKLPLIEFALPDSAVEDDIDDATLGLDRLGNSSQPHFQSAGDDLEQGGQKTILVAWSKRFDRSLKEINRLSARLNSILESEQTQLVDRVLAIKAKGQGQLGLSVQEHSDFDGYTYEALLCHGETPVSHIRWSADHTKIAVTRDFSPAVEGIEESAKLHSSLIFEKSDKVSVDLRVFGEAKGYLPEEPVTGYVEHAIITKDAVDMITVRKVADFFNQPDQATFTGSSFLTGRMLPDSITDGKPYRQEFIGYYKSYNFCKNGFDENAENLWEPTRLGPRFCVGRPAGRKRFNSFSEFVSTIKSLEPVGILKSETLKAIDIETSLVCP